LANASEPTASAVLSKMLRHGPNERTNMGAKEQDLASGIGQHRLRARTFVALVTLISILAFGGATADASGADIVASVAKAPIAPAGDVAGETTDLVITLDRSLDPAVDGRGLLAGRTIKITLPADFVYQGGPITNPGPPPACPPPSTSCGTGVLLQGWPQNPIPPSPANYTVSLEGTNTIVYTATRDLLAGDPSLNGPGIKQMHLILNNFVNPRPGRYEFHVVAQTGHRGSVETGTAIVHIRPNPLASIHVTSVFAGPPPFANTIYQTTTTGAPAPLDWNFLVWDREGEPASGVTINQINSASADLRYGHRVIGHIAIDGPPGATGQQVSGGPSEVISGPVKNLPTGRLTVRFQAGDVPGLYTTSLRMNGTGAPADGIDFCAIAPDYGTCPVQGPFPEGNGATMLVNATS
jgi:hypothetical protein